MKKKKTPSRRIDVNVEELDRVIDSAQLGPLSEADCEKLKTTLHALVERLTPRPHTEKTSAVLGDQTAPAYRKALAAAVGARWRQAAGSTEKPVTPLLENLQFPTQPSHSKTNRVS